MLFPKIIEYQPYSICNANCTYCPVGHLNREQKLKGKSISNEVFQALVDQTKNHKIERISPHLNCELYYVKNCPIKLKFGKIPS